jgi:outer membrane protein assembly factor BamB
MTRYKRPSIKLCGMLTLLTILLAGCNLPQMINPNTKQVLAGNDWPMYGYDLGRSSDNNETILNTSNIGQLSKLWTFQTQDAVAAPATVVGYTIYVGSWDGYEYALDSQTGALNWKTYLGKTVANPWCRPPKLGVTSGATVINGTLYVGGGDAYWYALNATTGAVEWKVFVGSTNAKVGYYNWSSPLIYKGYAYIGASSLGDCPLAQGKLLQVSLSTHKVVKTLDMVPNGQVGGGIWTSPSLDLSTQTLYLSTGTENALTQVYAQALLAVDLRTLTVKDMWHLPEQNAIIDSDFGGTPALFKTSTGTTMVTAVNKNGITYALRADDLKAGPVWQQYIAQGGPSPSEGDGSISTAAFANGVLYMAGGNTIINKEGYQGAVRALNPDNGKIIWEHPTTGPVLGALTYSNGILFASAGNVLEVLDAKNGARLASYTMDQQIYAATVVSHGQVIVGDTDGSVYDFGLPTSAFASTPTGTPCGSLTCWNIGQPSHAGNDTVKDNVQTITAGGYGLNINTDQIYFASQNVSGNTQITTRITSLQGASPLAQAGLMIRQDVDPGSPFYGVFVKKNHQLVILYRTTLSGTIASLAAPQTSTTLPIDLEIQRVGDLFQAATSTDGTHYTLIPGSSLTLALTTNALTGLASSAGDDQQTSTITYANLSIGQPTVSPIEVSSTDACPTGWSCGSVGNPTIVGSQLEQGSTWTIKGEGTDIGGYSDQFHFVAQSVTSNSTISARITAQDAKSSWAKAGLMMRQNSNPDAPYYAILLTPANGLNIEYRTSTGLRATLYQVPTTISTAPPLYMKIARSGNTYSAYQSPDGVHWDFILGTSIAINMTGAIQVGMAIASNNWQQTSDATFEDVQVAHQAPAPATLCPDTWMCNDVGYSVLPGSQIYNAGSWLLQGAGEDIAGVADQFHGVWQTLSNDGSVSARVTSIERIDPNSKAGVMLRIGMDPGSPYYAIFATPHDGLIVQYREFQAGNSALNNFPIPNKLPIYLKVTRVGNLFSAYYSQDGITWTKVGISKTINMPNKVFSGIAMTSHATLQEGTATFDSVHTGMQ